MLELEHGFRVVDVCTRLPPDGEDAFRGRVITPERLEREMHQAGITRAVVFPPARPETSYVASNNGVARHSVDRPFVAVARINGTQKPGTTTAGRLRNAVSNREPYHTTPEDIEKYAYDDRFHGFVFDPTVDDFPDEDVLAVLEDVDLPVIVRGGTDAPPEALATTVLERSFPTVVSHFGGYPLDRELMHEMIDLLEEYDDCYLETSFVRYREVLERALLEHPDRVLFGSGAPACHPDVAVMEILTLDVSEDKLWRAFSKNACRVMEALSPETSS
ncbi:amidohydrolase family protein [Natronorubrum sp. JWXQ-INN-674]|uniref:Amidohydrolase family protein n=1 Tax=Natronorubrum halalkaliphilum TaxID=2691917 RepID=A0A6B0VI85_9EURY|nr:amidohydrolase family protein [Natronorubrum halalkaliphilum]MXV60807.1 amidohydrolase family protein [Natronorubrum halalkaliphilum]